MKNMGLCLYILCLYKVLVAVLSTASKFWYLENKKNYVIENIPLRFYNVYGTCGTKIDVNSGHIFSLKYVTCRDGNQPICTWTQIV